MPTKAKQPPRESIGVLLTVLLDRDASNPWVELYHARSDRFLDVTYDVRYQPRAYPEWSCNCPATVPCKHIARADRLRRVQFYSALYAGQPAPVLRAHLDHHQGRVEAGMADEDDLAALDFIAIELGEDRAA